MQKANRNYRARTEPGSLLENRAGLAQPSIQAWLRAGPAVGSIPGSWASPTSQCGMERGQTERRHYTFSPQANRETLSRLPYFYPFQFFFRWVFYILVWDPSGTLLLSQGVKKTRVFLMQEGAATVFCFGNFGDITA